MWETLVGLIARYPLDIISGLFGLLPILVGLFYYKYLTISMKWVVVFFSLFFLKDSIALVHSLNRESNLYLYNLQSFLEITIVAIIYAFSLPGQLRLIALMAAVFLVLNVFFYSNQELSAGNLSTARIFILIVVLIYLSHVLNQALIKNIIGHDLFWISAGFLIYAAGTFFIFLFGTYLFDSSTPDDTFDFYWSVQEIIYILFCILAAIGLRMSYLERKTRPSL